MAHRSLPPLVSSDMHQIIAKAIFLRLVERAGCLPQGKQYQLILSRDEMLAAAEAEFEYDLTDDGSLIFRPVRP